MWTRLLQNLFRFALIAGCLYGGHLLLKDADLGQAWAHIGSIHEGFITAAIICVFVSYIALIGYDWLACRFMQLKVPFGDIGITACLANAVSNMLGFALLSGGAVRLRCYTALGVPVSAVAKISLFCTATFLLGLSLVASLGLTFDDMLFSQITGLDPTIIETAGIVILVFCLALPFITFFVHRIDFARRAFILPPPHILWAQYLVGLVDIMAVGTILYVLLPTYLTDTVIGYFGFLTLFSAALWLGLVSHVPGGLGVFEATIIAGLTAAAPDQDASLPSDILGALLVYRLFYYALPFLIAVAVLAISETRKFWTTMAQPIKRPAEFLMRLPDYFLPVLLAGTIAIAGVVLLVSGATPAATGRVDFLADFLPVGLIEGSHLLGSLVGLALLVVAHGIYQRFDSAYHATLALLTAGIIFSFTKGFDYEEAGLLAIVWLLVALSRRVFYRRSRLSMLDIGWSWWIFIVLTLSAVTWLLFFSYKHVEYDNYLWWQFALDISGDASRSLRSLVLLAGGVIALGIHQLFRPSATTLPRPTPNDLEIATKIIERSDNTTANLALTGDKNILFSQDKSAFVMFGETKRSLIAMGDPVGNKHCFAWLIWQLRELADRHHKRVAFYQVSDQYLPLYIDSGMQFARLGEEALVPLEGFTLEGSKYKELRQSLAKGEREGLSFRIVQSDEVWQIESELQQISDTWLKDKDVREKSFSLGSYRADYIRRFPVATVSREGKLVAFANIWASRSKSELSVDLMRQCPSAPGGTMDFLFSHMLQWGKDNGYGYMNLGMAPLSGFYTHRLAPLWTRLGSFIYTHGERLYNFRGIRNFKGKYHPEWRPRYLAYRGAPSILILLDVAILIAGSFIGLFRK